MGLFGSLGKIVSSVVVGPVLRLVAPKPAQAVTTLATSAVKTLTKPQNLLPLPTALKTGNFQPLIGQGIAAIGLATGNPALALSGITQTISQSTSPITGFAGGQPMALNIGGILGQVGGIFGGGQNPIFSTVGQVASLASQFFPSQQMSQVVQTAVAPMQVMSMGVPALRGMATALTREIFDAGGKVLARLGISYSASPGAFSSTLKRALASIASLARRTPSGTMVSILIGLGLTALEANMLTAWHAQRKKGRRMNAGNPRALRRAARRIKSFHRMCSTIDLLKSRSRRVGTSSRCGSCKKSPCRC